MIDIPRASRGETALFALALVLLTMVILVLADAAVLITRPFWVDELLSVMVAGRATPAQVIADLAAGADGGASFFHLALWLLRQVTGALTPPILRLASLACVLAALLVVFVVLRRGFPASAAAAGALAVGANALVIEHAYEARFYGPWLLATAIVAWLLARRQAAPTRANAIALAVAALVLVTVHFYGVITLGLLCMAGVAARGRTWRGGLPAVAPAALGAVGLLIVAPLALAQRAAYTVPSWLPDFRFAQLGVLLTEFWLAAIPLGAATLIVVATAAGRLGRRASPLLETRVAAAAGDAGIVALAALAVMPFALALLSLAGQPSMLPRYAIAAALAWGPWVALAASLVGPWGARLAVALLSWFWFVGYTREARMKTAFVQAVAEASRSYQRALGDPRGLPVLFTSTNVMFPVVAEVGGATRARYLELPDSTFASLFPDSTPLGQANRVTVLERDLARVHAARFGFPRLLPLAATDSLQRFFLLLPPGRLPAGFASVEHYAQTMFPRHRFARLQPDLSMLERSQVLGSPGEAASGKVPAELQKAGQSGPKE